MSNLIIPMLAFKLNDLLLKDFVGGDSSFEIAGHPGFTSDNKMEIKQRILCGLLKSS